MGLVQTILYPLKRNGCLSEILYSLPFKMLGSAQRKNQDWFDENDSSVKLLLEKKIHLISVLLSDPYSQLKRNVLDQVKQYVQKNPKY